MTTVVSARPAIALAALLLFAASFAEGADKIKVEKADDLPRHTYRIEGKAVDLLSDTDPLLDLASQVRTNLLDDLSKFEIGDATTLQGYYGLLGTIAFLDGDYEECLDYQKKSIDLEDKEPLRLMSGMTLRSIIHAIRNGGDDFDGTFEAEMARQVNALPYDLVEANVKQAKGRAEIVSENLILGAIEATVQPMLDKSDGEMTGEFAGGLVSRYFLIRHIIPRRDQIVAIYSDYLAVHKVEKADIWAERDEALEPGLDYEPVTVAIWDSGIDVMIYGDRMWTNAEEVPGNNLDDDGNGYIDDFNGIAWTLQAEKTTDLLYPIGDLGGDRKELQKLAKGLDDITSAIESEEASRVKKIMSEMERDEVRPFMENLSLYGSYAHGTHVGGIAAKGNPYIRLLAGRITFDHKIVPDLPTVEQARKDATMFLETVRYFQANGVRVVNMSWGGSLGSVESTLEMHNVGETPEGRKALAREIFEIGKVALETAIENAPEILFVASAGNSDVDVNFEEFLPSAFNFPNMMIVGAVDQAGDETSFTSFGNVDAYANGFEVVSYVPGGDELSFSGTSMSSPNVTNLAAKMLAIRPSLEPTELIEIIVMTGVKHMAGEREVLLIHPKRALAEVRSIKVGSR